MKILKRRHADYDRSPAIGLCDCGAEYNSSGQLLAPREQWGENTGEHPADIGRIP